MSAPEDRLVAAARRYHQVLEQQRRNAQLPGRYGVAMARDAIRADLEHAEDELHEAADAFGKSAP